MNAATSTKKFPRIDAAQERALAVRIRAGRSKGAHGDVFTADAMQAREVLINANYGLIGKALAMYSRRRSIPDDRYDDLWQLGCLGLMRAAELFNPELGWKFSTYAIPSILQIIKRGDRYDTAIKIPEQKWISGDMAGNAAKILSIIRLDVNESGEGYEKSENIDDFDPHLVDFVRAMLARISDARTRTVVELRFGIVGDREKMTLDKIGKRMGFGKEYARQLVNIGLTEIRESLQEENDE